MTRTAATGLLLLALAAPASAQTRLGFVEGALLADYDPTLRSDTTTTAGVSGAAGFFLTPRTSLRVEFDYPAWHGTHRTGESRVADHIEAFDLLEDDRAPSWSVLVGRHYGQENRASVAWVAGLTATDRQSRSSGWTETRDLDGNVIEHLDAARQNDGYRWIAGTAGADVAIKLGARLELVPQVRVHMYPFSEHTSLLFVRPRIGVRWQF